MTYKLLSFKQTEQMKEKKNLKNQAVVSQPDWNPAGNWC